MSSYNQVFGGPNIYPAQLTFKNISLSADLALEWPAEIATTNDVVAWIMRVSPTAGGFSIILDDATLASNGVSLLFYNAGAFTFTLKDSTGGTIASIIAGTGWDIILQDNSTAAGSWLVIQRGAGTTEAQASQLAGAGLVALGGLLASSVLVTDRSADFPITANGRATLFDWTGGSGAATIDATASLGTGWWTIVRNDGSGALTVSPATGQIDGASSKVYDPNSGSFIFQDGTNLFTIGFGAAGGGASFDYISIDISGASGGDYTLSGAQLNRIAYHFTGVLTGDVQVVIPSTVQEYWITNATTGAFSVAIRTSSQTPPGVAVEQDASIIGYCNGTIFLQAAGVLATPVPVAEGGTGATTATGALTNLGAAAVAVDNNFSANQTVVSVDGGATVGPLIAAFRNSSSPAASDVIGAFHLDGNDSAANRTTYASASARILDPTDGSEDGTFDFLTVVAGALARRGFVGQGLVIGSGADQGLGTLSTYGASATLFVNSTAAGGVAQFTSTDAGAAVGPQVFLIRDSASPAASDNIGAVYFNGRNSSAAAVQYGSIGMAISDATAGSEDAIGYLDAQVAGVQTDILKWGLGVIIGAPTGGLKGLGTINVQNAIYLNGVLFYEEGTFTPAITFGGSGTGIVYVTRGGSYTRIGNRVEFSLFIVTSNNGSGVGAAVVSALPFTAGASNLAPQLYPSTGVASITGNPLGITSSGASTLTLVQTTATGVSALTDTNLTDTMNITISGTYQT